jgi:hypothetical protein
MGGQKKENEKKGRRKKKTKLNTSLLGELCVEPMVRIERWSGSVQLA